MAFLIRQPADRYELIKWLEHHVGEEFIFMSHDALGDHEGHGWSMMWDAGLLTFTVHLDDPEKEMLCRLTWG